MDTKSLLERAAARTSINARQAKALADALAASMMRHAAEQDTVAVPGFGSFEPKKRLERINVHPATGRRMLLPPKIVIAFRPSALLRQKLK